MGGSFISLEKIRDLEKRMKDLGIEEKDIEERFVRSQGKGGQKVNKSSSCVYLKHAPTGIEVKCQKERSQSCNRFFARRMLADKIEESVQGRSSGLSRKIEKIRRQKKKSFKRAKAKVKGQVLK